MGHPSIRLGLLALALVTSAGAVAQNSVPSPPSASAPMSASPQDRALAARETSSQANAHPTPAQLDRPGAVAIAPPILRNAGKTVVSPDPPLLGRLNLRWQVPPGAVGAQAPALPPPANEGASDAGVAERARN